MPAKFFHSGFELRLLFGNEIEPLPEVGNDIAHMSSL